jgi:hypothetical protein
MSRFVKPKTVRLPLSQGDFIDVKYRLNAGEQQALFAKMSPHVVPGEKMRLDSQHVISAKIVMYLVGWSFTDDGRPVPMTPDLPEDVRLATINNLDTETFAELRKAIDAHEDAVDAEIAAAKNGQDGASGSSAISPSVDSLAGVTTTLPTLTLTSTTS